MSKALALPRNTTRQSTGMLYGNVARLLHRASGTIVVLFVLVHVVVQAIGHVSWLAGLRAPWLVPLQQQPWIHGILYFCIVFHTLYGLRLLAGDLGMKLDYRISLLAITALSLLPLLREMVRYAGI